jgi:integrase
VFRKDSGEKTIEQHWKDEQLIGWRGKVEVGQQPDGEADRRWITGETYEAVLNKMRAFQRDLAAGVEVNTASLKAIKSIPKRDRRFMAAHRIWTPQQVSTFLTEIRNHRLHAAYYLALTTPMRRSEVLKLRWTDVDWAGSQVAVHSRITLHGPPVNRPAEVTLASSEELAAQFSARREVVWMLRLPPKTMALLQQRREAQQAEQVQAGEFWQVGAEALTFTDRIGRVINGDTFAQQRINLVTRLISPQLRYCDLKRMASSLLNGQACLPGIISKEPSYTDRASALDVYAQLDEKRASGLSHIF